VIVNVPSWEDLRTISLQLYFKAWAAAVEIVTEFDDVYTDGLDWEDEWKGYIEASQADLQSIYTLIQQSQEIGIKALIARVSPFLLLKRHETKPTAPGGSTYDFSDFPTLDASELVRVHNVFCDTKLSDEFSTDFETLRRERNKIAHIGLFNKTLTPDHLIEVLIKQFQELYKDRAWLVERVFFISKHRWADYGDYDKWSPVGAALYELWKTLPRVTPKQFEAIFGRGPDEKRLICPACGPALEHFMDGNEPYARDIPTAFEAADAKIACAACGHAFALIAQKCVEGECDGEFVAVHDGDAFCVECGEQKVA